MNFESFQNELLTQFPSSDALPKKQVKAFVNVFCTCRLPKFEGEEMAQCDKCNEWYHQHCEDIPQVVFENTDADWSCSLCRSQ